MSSKGTSSKTDTSSLFAPFQFGKLKLKNRIVMAPMTRGMSPDGVPGQVNADYYQRRAKGGAGLILSEGTVIDRPAARNEPGIPFFHGEAALNGWKQVIDSVHSAGGLMGPQIWHVGSVPGKSGWTPEVEVESPSGLSGPGVKAGHSMTDADIADTIAEYAKAAANAKRLGFDMTEIHGAHGYLIDQFFWAATNLRDDAFGGTTLVERSRFALEIVRAMRAAVGPDFPIFMRLSQWKSQEFTARLAETPAAMEAWLTALAEAGVDVFHCSQRRFWEPEFPEIDGPEGLNFAGWAKKLTGKTTVSVGSVGLSGDFMSAFGGEKSQSTEIDALLKRLEREEFDLIAVGRAFIVNPDWPEKVRQGKTSELQGFDVSRLQELV